MVRYTLSWAGEPAPGKASLSTRLQHVDILKMEQLSEWYLCDVNKKGQVKTTVKNKILMF